MVFISSWYSFVWSFQHFVSSWFFSFSSLVVVCPRFVLFVSTSGSEHVFISIHGKPLLSVKALFKTALRKAGITDFRLHDLRHTFASHYVMNGGDLLSLKKVLGHQDLKMVQRYSHLASAYKRKMMNRLKGKFSICHLFATSEKIIPFELKNKAS
jgi:integrase